MIPLHASKLRLARAYGSVAVATAVALLLVDVLLIGLDGTLTLARAAGVDVIPSPGVRYQFSISNDYGLAERWNCLKWVVAAAAFAVAAVEGRRMGFALLSLSFAFLFLDDWGQLHEAANARMLEAGLVHDPALGGVISFALLGLLVFGSMAIAYAHGDAWVRDAVRTMTVLLLGLSVFGVGVDAIETAVFHRDGVALPGHAMASLIENGAELIFTSLIAAYAVRTGMTAWRDGARHRETAP